jgi:hypothetical protein
MLKCSWLLGEYCQLLVPCFAVGLAVPLLLLAAVVPTNWGTMFNHQQMFNDSFCNVASVFALQAIGPPAAP